MQSESANAASNAHDAGGTAPAGGSGPDETNQKQSQSETLAATASSFPGLAASSSGSSTDIICSGLSGSGQTINVGQSFGRYHIQKVLGSGSMGSVFLAHDSQLDRPVALRCRVSSGTSTGSCRSACSGELRRRDAHASEYLSHLRYR